MYTNQYGQILPGAQATAPTTKPQAPNFFQYASAKLTGAPNPNQGYESSLNNYYQDQARHNAIVRAVNPAPRSQVAINPSHAAPNFFGSGPTPQPAQTLGQPVQPRVPQATPTPMPSAQPTQGNLTYNGPQSQLGPLITQTAKQYGLHPRLLAAIIGAESGGNPKAYRNEPSLGTASYGVGQVLGTTAQQLGLKGSPEQLYDPKVGVDYIGRYIQHKRQLFPQANFNDPLSVYEIYNSGKPGGGFYPGAKENFIQNYNQAKQAYR